MKHKSLTILSICVSFGLWLLLTGCNLSTTAVGEVQSETRTVNIDSASSASVQIEFGAGELHVDGGADNLMDGSFRYNVAEWQPQVDYSESEKRGKLLISHQGKSVPVGDTMINDWDLQFSNVVPLELSIHTGAGESQLNLAALDLTAVSIETGVGTTHINLNGDWQHDLHVAVTGGIGEITIDLPTEMGVRVNADTALVNVTMSGLTKEADGYVNDASQTAPYALTLDLEAGIGSVVLDASE
mgnify:CR=1 FL=1